MDAARILDVMRKIGRCTAGVDPSSVMDEILAVTRDGLGFSRLELAEPGSRPPLAELHEQAAQRGVGFLVESFPETLYVAPIRSPLVDSTLVGATTSAPDPDLLATLELTAGRLGISLANARLLHEKETALARLARRADETEALNEIARIATSGDELRPMLQRMASALVRRFSWEFLAIVSIDERRERFVCEAVESEVPTSIQPGYGRELGSGVVGRVATSAEPILLDDVRTCAFYIETFPGVLSELCVPVVFEGRVLAVVNLESRGLATFHDQLRLLQTVAEQIAGAIHLATTVRRLREAKARLEEAQRKIARLVEPLPETLEDLAAWARSIASDIAESVRASEIGVFILENGAMTSLVVDRTSPPSSDELRRLSSGSFHLRSGGEFLVPIEGLSGDRYGALVVPGSPIQGGDEERLLWGFARQLGGALELRRMRRQLAAAREQRQRDRRLLLEKGVPLLRMCRLCGACFDEAVERCPYDDSLLDDSHALPLLIAERYRIIRRLGQGGMGVVFAAADQKLSRQVALKVIRKEQLENLDARTRLRREALTAARVQHPSVVALHDSGELEDGSVYLVLELLTGQDLGRVLSRDGRGTPRQVAAFLRQGAAGLHAAHRAGIVHRDVKPENFMLSGGPSGLALKLFDFGLARSVAFDRGITIQGTMVGTPAYMSPEQARGEQVEVKSDLYSFAAVAYEALLGFPAVEGRDLHVVLRRVLEEPPAVPSLRLPELSSSVDRAFAAALSKSAADRPASLVDWAEGLARDLEITPSTTAGWTLG